MSSVQCKATGYSSLVGRKISSWFIRNPILEPYLIFCPLGDGCCVTFGVAGGVKVMPIGGGCGGDPWAHGCAMPGVVSFPLVSTYQD